MTYKLKITKTALKEWKKLDVTTRNQFKKKLKDRLNDPHIESSKLRSMPGCYKIKLRTVGYRLVYQVVDDIVTVEVITVGRRDGQIYKKAAELLSKTPPTVNMDVGQMHTYELPITAAQMTVKYPDDLKIESSQEKPTQVKVTYSDGPSTKTRQLLFTRDEMPVKDHIDLGVVEVDIPRAGGVYSREGMSSEDTKRPPEYRAYLSR